MKTSKKLLFMSMALSAGVVISSLSYAVATNVTGNINVTDVVKNLENNADLKIRFMDTFEAMRLSKEGQIVSKELEEKRKELAKNVEAEEKKIAQVMTEYRSKASTLSDTARNKEEQRLTKMKREYESMIQGSEEELKLVMQHKTEALAKEVDKAVTQIAKAEGLDAVIDRMSGRVIYASSKGDFTGKITCEMNKQFDVKVATTKGVQSGTSVASNKK